MRQGDGSDFLDAGDPRCAEIGVIYVESMDSRQEILTALNLLNMQGRKQIALVLSEPRQVFREQVDFDGLKQARRDLRAQLIVITSSGTSAWEYARARRFPVYSSLASLKHTLLTETTSASSSQAGGQKRPSLLAFGSRKSNLNQARPTIIAPPAPLPPAPPQGPGAPGTSFPTVPPTPQVQGSPLSPLPPNVPTARTQGQPVVPLTPHLPEQPVEPPPTPIDIKRKQASQAARAHDDETLYAPSAQANQPPAPAPNPNDGDATLIGDLPATPIKRTQGSKAAPQPQSQRPSPIVFPGGKAAPATQQQQASGQSPSAPLGAAPTLASGVPPTNAPGQPPRNMPNQQQASGQVPAIPGQPPKNMPNQQYQTSGQVPAIQPGQSPAPLGAAPTLASGALPTNAPGQPPRNQPGQSPAQHPELASQNPLGVAPALAPGALPNVPGQQTRNVPGAFPANAPGQQTRNAPGAFPANASAQPPRNQQGQPPAAPLRVAPALAPGGIPPLQPPRSGRDRRRFWRRTLLGIGFLLIILLIGGIWASAQGDLKLNPFTQVTAKVTITPASRLEENTFIISAQPGFITNSTSREVPARNLSATSTTQTATGNATAPIPATTASGQLTFQNTTGSSVTLGTTTLTTKDGIQIRFNGPVVVPGLGSAHATGNAVNPGAAGNIPAVDFSGSCCAPGIFVNNPSAFSGGVDAIPNSEIQQSDIDNAANPLVTSLTTSTRTSLQGQVRSNEHVVDSSFKCTPTITADQKAGDQVKSVHVSVSVNCKEEVYDFAAAQSMAIGILQDQAANDSVLTPQYARVGDIVVNQVSASIVSADGKVNLLEHVRGLWGYQFTDQMKHNIALKLVKLSLQSASDVLQHWPGVGTARIDLSSGNTMPDNVNNITLNILPLTGPSLTPSGSPGGSNGTPGGSTPPAGSNNPPGTGTATPGGIPGGSSQPGAPGSSSTRQPGGSFTSPTTRPGTPTPVNGLGGS